MPFTMRTGTFQTPTSTGSGGFDTGLGELPSAVWVATVGTNATDGIQQGIRACFGASDGTNQWTVGMSAQYQLGSLPAAPGSNKIDSQTKFIRLCNDAGTITLEGNVTALEADGSVTINWTTVPATQITVGFAAWAGFPAQVGTKFIASTDATPITVTTTVQPTAVATFSNAGTDFTFGGGYSAAGYESVTGGSGIRLGARNDGSMFWADPFGGHIRVVGVGGIGQAETTYQAYPTDFAATSFKYSRIAAFQAHASRAFSWIAFGDPAVADSDSLQSYNGTDHWDRAAMNGVPRGALTFAQHEYNADLHAPFGGILDTEVNTVSFGAFDDQSNQWNMILYAEEPLDFPRDMIVTRAFYDGEVSTALLNESTWAAAKTVTFAPDTSGAGTLTTVTSGTYPGATNPGETVLMFIEPVLVETAFVPQIYRLVIV